MEPDFKDFLTAQVGHDEMEKAQGREPERPGCLMLALVLVVFGAVMAWWGLS
ncbi:MAG: hypothetical protein KMY53_06160 [Desulfarculus sp.]|nr:hypothetical protein [Pseudomonadota bacterium]MBU4576075.1 hypothetical protein [Pseudomonadota bacterium]MBU4599446.1 hypothetical protein [Pseudomonadota bacterium]MBV1717081.1 hypothetical protein [Desulfarculus sp.]MBV1737728.1 hypothetical protein [Desulfarculus sp.]